MNQRVGEENAWTARARQAKTELEREIAMQTAAIAKLPITEAELKKLLADLAQHAKDKDAKEKFRLPSEDGDDRVRSKLRGSLDRPRLPVQVSLRQVR